MVDAVDPILDFQNHASVLLDETTAWEALGFLERMVTCGLLVLAWLIKESADENGPFWPLQEYIWNASCAVKMSTFMPDQSDQTEATG